MCKHFSFCANGCPATLKIGKEVPFNQHYEIINNGTARISEELILPWTGYRSRKIRNFCETICPGQDRTGLQVKCSVTGGQGWECFT